MILATLVLVVAGVLALSRLPIDAVPDVTSVQVEVITTAPALGPLEVEQFITRPVENAMSGIPRLEEVRSVSRYGISAVTVVFEDGTDIYWARHLVEQRLSDAAEAIPPWVEQPKMGPIATGLGEIYHFVVVGDGYSPMELRTILDWDIAYRLRSVPGVVEVNAWGGLAKQYQVLVDPSRLRAYRLTLPQVFDGDRAEQPEPAAAGSSRRDGEGYVIRGEGMVTGVEDLEQIAIGTGDGGTPILVRHVAQVRVGAALRTRRGHP